MVRLTGVGDNATISTVDGSTITERSCVALSVKTDLELAEAYVSLSSENILPRRLILTDEVPLEILLSVSVLLHEESNTKQEA